MNLSVQLVRLVSVQVDPPCHPSGVDEWVSSWLESAISLAIPTSPATAISRTSPRKSEFWCPLANVTSQVPAALKAADLARFEMRASQLEKAKPVISYYF
jgi:hypothetical protein